MIYREMCGEKVSLLGMGNMRLPTTGEGEHIDFEKAQAIIDRAYAAGVNYFDTAFRYHGGESETFIGQALAKYPRDSWFLASKLPGHMMERGADGLLHFNAGLAGQPPVRSVAEVFERQLEKCGVDHFDFYLLHNLCESSYDFYMDEQIGVVPYLLEQQKKGRIRHMGFSSHGQAEVIDQFLSHWEGVFEFVQIQLNYLDWRLQGADKKVAAIARHGAKVVVMEPCRGGRLADINPRCNALLKQARPQDSIAPWAFRFVMSIPEVSVVLSGMSTLEQLEDNLATSADDTPLTPAEKRLLLEDVVGDLIDLIPCTGCRYCTEGCPQGLDIPRLIALQNEMSYESHDAAYFILRGFKPEALPGACIGCGACASICPQGIDVPGVLRTFAQRLAADERA